MAGQDPMPGERPGRVDPQTGLPLPEPYPEYIACLHCGEPEVEIWCYQARVRCHNCGEWILRAARCPPASDACRPYLEQERRRNPPAG